MLRIFLCAHIRPSFPKVYTQVDSLTFCCLKQSTLQGRASGYTSCYYPTNGAQKEQWISQKQCTPYTPPRPAKTGIQRQPAKKDPKPSIHVWRKVKPCSTTGWSDTRIAKSLLSADKVAHSKPRRRRRTQRQLRSRQEQPASRLS
jgi:hypothetical protein